MSFDGSIKFDTKLDEKGFAKGVKGLENVAQKSFNLVKNIAKTASVAVVGIGVASLKVGSDFEEGMSEVKAISGATGDEFEALKNKAKEMGATTKFSATESAEALKYMGMAGWKSEQMLAGLPGVMNLAAASGEELGMVSDIVTDALSAFKMEAGEASKFADLLANTSTNSNTNVAMMGETFKYVAPVAGALGYSAEDAALGIGLMANAGIKASQSGTAMRGMMTRMVKPTKESAAAMEMLGLKITDSNDQMKPFKEVMEDIRSGMTNFTPEIQAQIAAMLAGQNGMSGLLAIVNATEEDFNKLSDATTDYTGAAKEMAEIMNDNLKGDFVLLQSALEGLGIQLYESSDFARELVQGLEDIVSVISNTITGAANVAKEFDEMSDSLGGAQLALGGTEELMDGMKFGLEEIGNSIAAFVSNALIKLTEAIPTIINITNTMIEALINSFTENKGTLTASIADIIVSMIDMFIVNTPLFMSAGIEFITAITQGIAESSPQLIETFTTSISGLVDTIIENAPLLMAAGTEILTSIMQGITENTDQIGRKALEIVQTIVEGIITNLPLILDAGLKMIQALGEGLVGSLPEISGTLVNAISGLLNIIGENLPGIIEFGLELILALVDGIVEAMPVLVEAIPEIIEQIVDIFLENLPAIIEAGGEIILALIDGIVEILPELAIMAVEIIEKLADGLSEHLPDIIQTGIEIILALADGLVQAIPKLLDKIPGIIEKVVVAILDHLPDIIVAGIEIIVALGIGLLRALPRLLAVIPKIVVAIAKALLGHDWLGTGKKILTAVKNGLSSMISTLGAAASKAGKAAIDKIKEKFGEGKEKGKELISKIVDGIKGTASKLWTEASELATKALDKIKEGFTGALDIGKNLVEGIWNGISGATGWLMGKVKGFANDVIDGVKGFFGIHSPSRVFRDEIGTQLVRGIVVGIQEETPALRKASEKEMMKLVDDYAIYGKKVAEAYGQLNKEEMAELRKQHIKERKITKKMTQKEIDEVKKQRVQDGRDLAEAIAKGIEEKTATVVAALEKLREQSIRELDKLGDATVKALKAKYEEEEKLLIDNIDKRLNIERDASKKRITVYEEEQRKKILLLDTEQAEIVRMLQAQIDSINGELDAEKEANEEREYQKKLAEAKEKVRVAKTNRERLEAQKAVEELITEKERKEFEKRKKQEIKDLQDAMKAVEDNAKDKIAQLEEDIKSNKEYEEEKLKEIEKGFEDEKEATRKHYEVLLKEEQLQAEARKLILAENNEELVELLDSYNPYWMDAGQSFGESLLDGLNSMKYEIEDVVNDMLSMVATAEIANAKIIQAKLDYEAARIAGDKKGMAQAHKQAEAYRKQGGNIGKDIALKTANYEREINQKTKSEKDYNPYSKGVTQNIKIVSPSNTPAENARLMKRKGEELTLGY